MWQRWSDRIVCRLCIMVNEIQLGRKKLQYSYMKKEQTKYQKTPSQKDQNRTKTQNKQQYTRLKDPYVWKRLLKDCGLCIKKPNCSAAERGVSLCTLQALIAKEPITWSVSILIYHGRDPYMWKWLLEICRLCIKGPDCSVTERGVSLHVLQALITEKTHTWKCLCHNTPQQEKFYIIWLYNIRCIKCRYWVQHRQQQLRNCVKKLERHRQRKNVFNPLQA